MTLTKALLQLNRAEMRGYGQRNFVLQLLRGDGTSESVAVSSVQVFAEPSDSKVLVQAQVVDVEARRAV